MFEIQPVGHGFPGAVLIKSGQVFCGFDNPQTFLIKATAVSGGLTFVLNVKKDPTKNAFEIQTEFAENVLRFTFFNPSEVGTSGVIRPALVAAVGTRALRVSFFIQRVHLAESILLSYQFDELDLPPSEAPTQDAAAQTQPHAK